MGPSSELSSWSTMHCHFNLMYLEMSYVHTIRNNCIPGFVFVA